MSIPDNRPASPRNPPLLPWPSEIATGPDSLAVAATLRFEVSGDARVQAAAGRLWQRWQERTGLLFRPIAAETAGGRTAGRIVIRARREGGAHPALGGDESYRLVVTRTGARLDSATTWGALRGLATLEQCLAGDTRGWFLPSVRIRDRPRFAWRGLLIDVCRHVISVESIKRQLDGMALAKFNVLHFHLTNDQGFRIESRRFPRLHEYGSDGNYFTQSQVREIVT